MPLIEVFVDENYISDLTSETRACLETVYRISMSFKCRYRIYIHTYIHTYRHTYIHACIHTCMHTYIQTYRHTDIQTYRHRDIHTYIYIYNISNTYMYTYLIYTHIHRSAWMGICQSAESVMICISHGSWCTGKTIIPEGWRYDQQQQQQQN